jgi:hypothetical protein
MSTKKTDVLRFLSLKWKLKISPFIFVALVLFGWFFLSPPDKSYDVPTCTHLVEYALLTIILCFIAVDIIKLINIGIQRIEKRHSRLAQVYEKKDTEKESTLEILNIKGKLKTLPLIFIFWVMLGWGQFFPADNGDNLLACMKLTVSTLGLTVLSFILIAIYVATKLLYKNLRLEQIQIKAENKNNTSYATSNIKIILCIISLIFMVMFFVLTALLKVGSIPANIAVCGFIIAGIASSALSLLDKVKNSNSKKGLSGFFILSAVALVVSTSLFGVDNPMRLFPILVAGVFVGTSVVLYKLEKRA